MSWHTRKRKSLNPDSPDQMDAFNEEYSRACRLLEIPREQMQVTSEQAAKYLECSQQTVVRYIYQDPPMFDVVRVRDQGRRYHVELTLDSVVEYRMLTKRYKNTKLRNAAL